MTRQLNNAKSRTAAPRRVARPELIDRTFWVGIGVVLVAIMCRPALAGGGPQNVALVVNPNDVDSLTIANHYVALRGIPSRNIIHVPWRANAQRMSAKAFSQDLLRPVLATIKERKLESQIDVIAYSCGFPYYVDFSRGFDGASGPPTAKPALSLNSATFLYASILGGKADVFGPNSNSYFAPPVNGKVASQAFRADQAWAMGGRPAGQSGRKYYASTMLGVTFGRGSKVDEIVEYLSRGKQADGSRPKGTIYYMQNANVRSRARHDTFPAAVAELNRMGVAATIVQGRQPRNRPDIAGLTTGATHVLVRASGSSFLPGALVDNLTSAGGQLQIPPPKNKNPQTPVVQYLREGATGASGTVIEPFAIGAKFPNAFLHVHYARGCSMVEAFYLSVQAPYQLLIVGDPLCQPWAQSPQVTVQGLAGAATMTGTVALRPTAAAAGGVKEFHAYVDGELVASCQPDGQLKIDTTQLANGWRRLRVVAIDDTPIAVQGQWTGLVEIKNEFGVVQLSTPTGNRTSLGGALTVDVRSSQAGATTVFHLGRKIGVVDQTTGQVRITVKECGKGPVLLEARQEGAATTVARPLVVQVD